MNENRIEYDTLIYPYDTDLLRVISLSHFHELVGSSGVSGSGELEQKIK